MRFLKRLARNFVKLACPADEITRQLNEISGQLNHLIRHLDQMEREVIRPVGVPGRWMNGNAERGGMRPEKLRNIYSAGQ